jgi:hypothetical protein
MPIGSYWTLDGTPPAATTACLAPEKAGADGRRCPYREHVLKSLQGHGTWEVLVACRGQQRFTPSGHVIGIETNAALRVTTCHLVPARQRRESELTLPLLPPAARESGCSAAASRRGRPPRWSVRSSSRIRMDHARCRIARRRSDPEADARGAPRH